MFTPSPPQGFTSEQQLVIINRRPIPLFEEPQGRRGPRAVFEMLYEVDLETMGYEIDWFDVAWLQRIELTINAGQVPSTQNDFPLLINDTYSDLIGEVEAELRFSGDDNIQLEYEIEKFDNLTGELVVWINKPTVSDGDIVRIYFDNPAAVDEQDSGLVWSDYNAVYHLNQTTFGASSTLDSTANNEDGTPQNMDITNQVNSQINGSLDFNGIDEFILLSTSSLLEPGTGAFTASAWVRPDENSRNYIVGKQDPASPFNGWFFNMSNSASDRRLFIQFRDNGLLQVRGTQQLTIGVLHHVIFTYDGSDNASGVRIFIDGVEDTANIESDTLLGGVSKPTIEFNIGNLGNTQFDSLSWNGIIDEVNISAIVKTPDFITTSFNNQNDQSTFYSTGTVEAIPSIIAMEYQN